MRKMTGKEIRNWLNGSDFLNSIEKLPIIIDEVRFDKFINSIQFSYKNASGLIFPSNGYLGECGGLNYYPLMKLSCKYSEDERYNPTFEPNLGIAAKVIKQSWAEFTKN